MMHQGCALLHHLLHEATFSVAPEAAFFPLPQRFEGVVCYRQLRGLREGTKETLKLRPARIETCPVVQVEVPVVREKVYGLCAERVLSDSLVVGINRAVQELEFLRAYLVGRKYLHRIFHKLVTKICELVRKVRASWNQDMVCLVGLCMVKKAVHSAVLVSDELPEAALVLDLDNFPL